MKIQVMMKKEKVLANFLSKCLISNQRKKKKKMKRNKKIMILNKKANMTSKEESFKTEKEINNNQKKTSDSLKTLFNLSSIKINKNNNIMKQIMKQKVVLTNKNKSSIITMITMIMNKKIKVKIKKKKIDQMI